MKKFYHKAIKRLHKVRPLYLWLAGLTLVCLVGTGLYVGAQSGVKPQQSERGATTLEQDTGGVESIDKSSSSVPDPTDATNSTQQGTNNSTGSSGYTPYTPSECTTTAIPYTTEYIDAPDLYPNQGYSNGGRDGYIKTCTASSTGYKPEDIVSKPYNKRVYVGTRGTSSSPTYSYDQALQMATNQCIAVAQSGGTDSSAYQQCLSAALNSYGY